MPHRLIGSLTELMSCALATVILAAADAIARFGVEVIYDKMQLRVVCLLGASVGALISVLALPAAKNPEARGVKTMAAKWLTSWGTGVCFTPALMRWLGVPADVDMALATSAAVAFAGVAVLHLLIRIVTHRLGRLAAGEEPEK